MQAPELLTAEHSLDGFNSGVSSLDDWPRRRAVQNQASGASRTFVVCESGGVVADCALAASAVAPDAAPGRFRRNMPDPIPVAVLARLAIAQPQQGLGLGRALFQDTAHRAIRAVDTPGSRGLLVHAISEEAKAFYLCLELDPSPLEPMTLMTTVASVGGDVAVTVAMIQKSRLRPTDELQGPQRTVRAEVAVPTVLRYRRKPLACGTKAPFDTSGRSDKRASAWPFDTSGRAGVESRPP
jgi:GNAT superfamily N-acetyltransferase